MGNKVGRVKWFNDRKGFGFIEGDNQQDIFVHHTDILADGYRSLKEGDLVEYLASPGPKGLKASAVRRVADEGRGNFADPAEAPGIVSGMHPRHEPERG